MDEKKLTELLKDAVAETPPPTFTHADVTRESDRQRTRRRNGLLTGSAFGVAVLAGATALGVALWTGESSPSQVTSAESDAAAGNGNAAPYELPDEDAKAAAPTERGQDQGFPPETPKQGGSSEGNGGPAGPTGTPSGCEQVDRELAAALAGELPAAANIKVDDALPVSFTCPAGSRGAAFYLPEGQISVVMLPGSEAMSFDSNAGTTNASAPTSTGDQVIVISDPVTAGATAPYASDLYRFARAIAGIY
jgi:hypothetical protein